MWGLYVILRNFQQQKASSLLGIFTRGIACKYQALNDRGLLEFCGMPCLRLLCQFVNGQVLHLHLLNLSLVFGVQNQTLPPVSTVLLYRNGSWMTFVDSCRPLSAYECTKVQSWMKNACCEHLSSSQCPARVSISRPSTGISGHMPCGVRVYLHLGVCVLHPLLLVRGLWKMWPL